LICITAMGASFGPCLPCSTSTAGTGKAQRTKPPTPQQDQIVKPRPPMWESSELAAYGGSLGKRMNLRLRRHIELLSRLKPSSTFLGSRPRCDSKASGDHVETLKAKQRETLKDFAACEASGDWEQLHCGHFDWWMFPIDDGSKPEFNLRSEDDVTAIRSDRIWFDGYHEAVRFAAAAWGWDVATSMRIDPRLPGMGYTANKDVRLFKMCRSLYLFEDVELLASMQAFAREVQLIEKGGRKFYHKRIVLDELLYLSLPRRCPVHQFRRISSDEQAPAVPMASPPAFMWAPTPEPSTRRKYDPSTMRKNMQASGK